MFGNYLKIFAPQSFIEAILNYVMILKRWDFEKIFF